MAAARARLTVVRNEAEADLLVSALRDAGFDCTQRLTNFGAGATDGVAIGGAREILVRTDELDEARAVLDALLAG